MPRTKKSPTPTPVKVTGAELPMETPKGSGPSVPPSDLEARVAALEVAVMTLAIHLPSALWETANITDKKTTRMLVELEALFAAAGTLARLRLPESAFVAAAKELAALPTDTQFRWAEVRRRLQARFDEMARESDDEVPW